MANTFIKLSTITVGVGGSSTIDFTNIPQTFTDLKLVMSLRNTGTSGEFYLRFNGVSTNHSDRWLYGNGSSVGSITNVNIDLFNVASDQTASVFGSAEVYIPNYTSSNYKPVSSESVQENNATATYLLLEAGLWSSTAAITRITLVPGANSFAQYSTATLYGIKNS